MKALLLAASAALLATACSSTSDDETTAAGEAAPAGMPAIEYIANAASSDMFEIQSGQLALQRSCDPTVRAFGQMIVDDHTRTTALVTQAAQSDGVTPPPPQMMPRHMEMLQRLQAAGPGGFESAFRNEQATAHQEALTLHQTYSQDGDRPALRAVASQAVPVIQMHLNQVQSLPSTAACATQAPAPTTDRRRGERG
jgi:putative membrane protein